MLVLLVFLLSVVAFGEYCIQVAANPDFEVIKGYYDYVKKFEKARIEKKGNVYILRVGATNIRSELQAILPFIKRKFPDAYIKICEINEKYVVYPKTESSAYMEASKIGMKSANENLGSSEDIMQIRKTVEYIKNKIDDLNGKETSVLNSGGGKVDKFLRNFILISGVIVLFFMFLTFILLIIVLKNIRKTNGDVMKVFLEMINALKILNLLNNGYVLKMDKGKLFFWDEQERKWKEVKK